MKRVRTEKMDRLTVLGHGIDLAISSSQDRALEWMAEADEEMVPSINAVTNCEITDSVTFDDTQTFEMVILHEGRYYNLVLTEQE